MGIKLHCKRSKLFLKQDDNDGSKRFMVPAGATIVAPNWVTETPGFALGLKDGSIVDVTPARKGETKAVVEPEPEPVVVVQPPPPLPKDDLEKTDAELEADHAKDKRPLKNRLPTGAGLVGASTARRS
jgi:hypothetical protein